MTQPYAAKIGIMKGVKILAANGAITIGDGTVRLLGTKGDLLGEAPSAKTYAKGTRMTWGSGVTLYLDGQAYRLSRSKGNWSEALVSGLKSNAAATSVFAGRKFAKSLYAALQADGGHKGKPAAA